VRDGRAAPRFGSFSRDDLRVRLLGIPDGDRAAVIAKYERWLADQHHLLRALGELRGRDLVCYCAPRSCHGDLLLRLANAAREERIAWWRAVKAAA